MLEEKLKSEAKEELQTNLEDVMENELVCAICSELMIQVRSQDCCNVLCKATNCAVSGEKKLSSVTCWCCPAQPFSHVCLSQTVTNQNTEEEEGQTVFSKVRHGQALLSLQATSLNCSHSFCALCIKQWQDAKKPKALCPNCREPITSSVRSLVLDNYIDKVVELLKDEVKERRKELVLERKGKWQRDQWQRQ